MKHHSHEKLHALLREKICTVCIDRNVDGSCDREEEGRCTLIQKLPEVADAVLKVSSNRMDPYIQSIRENVCARCELRNLDGSCDQRDTDQCMLNSYLPLVVEAIEEHFEKEFRPLDHVSAKVL